jgi:hypothetical protein
LITISEPKPINKSKIYCYDTGKGVVEVPARLTGKPCYNGMCYFHNPHDKRVENNNNSPNRQILEILHKMILI